MRSNDSISSLESNGCCVVKFGVRMVVIRRSDDRLWCHMSGHLLARSKEQDKGIDKRLCVRLQLPILASTRVSITYSPARGKVFLARQTPRCWLTLEGAETGCYVSQSNTYRE
jgi:hypothetical protein